jgi:hypothetical protein
VYRRGNLGRHFPVAIYYLPFALFAPLAVGCLAVPIPESSPVGAQVTANDADSFKPGVTTKAQIIERLGTPQVELPDLRLIAYEWDQVDYQMLYLLVGMKVVGGVKDVKGPHAFFVAFDQKDRVRAYSFEKIGLWRGTPIQEAAREWAKGQGIVVPDLSTGFAALDVPTGQAVLYIYHVSGSPAPSPQVWVDGKLEAELKPATYTAMTLPSGEHMVRVVAIPESLPPDPGTTIALVMAPNTKHFLSLKNPWVSWTGELVEIKFQSEQEAMPVLSQMKPAR